MTGRLVLDDVAIGYDGQPLAEGIDLVLSGSSTTCLMGPNGVGKTTLFKTVLGIVPPLRGRIMIGGDDIATLRPEQIARRIAHVPQAYQGDPSHSVIDIVVMGRTARLGIFAAPGRDDYAAAWRALESLGIADIADRSADRISGGQRQLMLIARALTQDTELIIMDEPTASLDLGNRFGLLDQIRALSARGLSLLVSTHEPEHAFAIADHVVILGRGQPVAVGPVDGILTAERLRELYGLDLAIETTPMGRRVVTRSDLSATPAR
ncbi:putative ABC transporter ATP-binding protein [Rhodopseudomonas palustris]|uniref:ABC transporter ATP-binding protein n=3 Tax=Rhodopseudomonas palustris TaxID=1076 RepID=Q6NDF9_RHOPA|nr:ABC transporter ATP-binding protein [Rhodopseudomonas palustris]OPF97331.1 ABC transporter [Rhodopseudomonas palustris]QQM01637.1 putative ABC transporter ATP-binding protein [Rhodopseudomonas palustris]WAB77866.1 ABC transporter ATP-binding protein [Rhodopseudomonas palustris]WCL90272.1 ABC transporter ATP-binding protein [Rhodopseudomonas palustris CGA009]WND51777.1 ABC transporter ATP-binding protein [Rhodopseudomonas palustris]